MKKNILIDLQLEGMGIVNFDSNDQKWFLDNTDLRNYRKHSNINYSKKNFYKDEMGELVYKHKISRDCIIHDIYKNDMISQNPNIMHHDALLYSFIASNVSLVRGYLFASKTNTLKKRSCLSLCDAEQTCNAVSYIETFSRSGEKVSNMGDTDTKDTSFYLKENIGQINYKTNGIIDLNELQFISCDTVFDRKSFNSDKFDLYKRFLSQNIPNFNSELGYYQLKNSVIEIPEYGILLNNENILFLVKQTLSKILNINIRRKGSFAKTSSLRIKLVDNPLIDKFNDDNNWITILNEDDINNLSFDVYQFYQKIDMELAEKQRTEILRGKEEDLKADKEKKEIKKANTDKRKNNKTEDDE